MHASTLKQYLNSSIVPKGLTIELKPATSELSPANKAKWDSVLKSASLDLIRIIIDHHQTNSELIVSNEKILFPRLRKYEAESLASHELRIRDKLSQVKATKFARDNVTPKPDVPPARTPTVKHQEDVASNNVVNLSSAVLSDDDLSILSRGLSFCATTGGFSEFLFFKDLDNFARTMRLK